MWSLMSWRTFKGPSTWGGWGQPLIFSHFANSQRDVIRGGVLFVSPDMTFWPWLQNAQNLLAGDQVPLRNSELRCAWNYHHPKHRGRVLSSEFRHTRAYTNRDTKQFPGLKLQHAAIPGIEFKEFSTLSQWTIQEKSSRLLSSCQVHITIESQVSPAQLQIPSYSQLQACNRIVGTMMHPEVTLGGTRAELASI